MEGCLLAELADEKGIVGAFDAVGKADLFEESSHALAYAAQLAPTMDKDQIVVINLSGRGDKDIHTVAALEGIEV